MSHTKYFVLAGVAGMAAAVGVWAMSSPAARKSAELVEAPPVVQGAPLNAAPKEAPAPVSEESKRMAIVAKYESDAAKAASTEKAAVTPAPVANSLENPQVAEAPPSPTPGSGVLDLAKSIPAEPTSQTVAAAIPSPTPSIYKADMSLDVSKLSTPTPTPDPSHPDAKMLDFATLAGFKYEVFIPEEGSRPEDLPKEAQKDQIPANIRLLNGQKVAVKGFMVPTIFETDGVKAFILTRSRSLCCFGQMPQMNEWIDITMEKDKKTEFFNDMVVTAYGTLEVGEQREGGVVLSIYRMKADAVTADEEPVK
ncbi:MAG: DUF3299 domain-containing protein [Candidatus Sumerlaeaceae bacterium]|nr:DUF3299 domain-containing protein [Candidatus Sumerlaeaceae bacterium]